MDVDDVRVTRAAAQSTDRPGGGLIEGRHRDMSVAEEAGHPGLPGPAAPRLRHDPGRHGHRVVGAQGLAEKSSYAGIPALQCHECTGVEHQVT